MYTLSHDVLQVLNTSLCDNLFMESSKFDRTTKRDIYAQGLFAAFVQGDFPSVGSLAK